MCIRDRALRCWTETAALRAAYPTFPPAAAIAGRSSPPVAGLLDVYKRQIQEGAILEKVLPEVRTMELSALEDYLMQKLPQHN